MKENQAESAATGGGRGGTDDTTLIDRILLGCSGCPLARPSPQFNNYSMSRRYPDIHSKI